MNSRIHPQGVLWGFSREILAPSIIILARFRPKTLNFSPRAQEESLGINNYKVLPHLLNCFPLKNVKSCLFRFRAYDMGLCLMIYIA